MSHRSRAGSPSIRCPASREMISDSVDLWETDVCFLHIQLPGTDVLLPKIHKTLPEVDFESSRSLAKSDSWITQVYSAVPCSPHDNIDDSHLCDEDELNFVCRLSHAWVHFVTDLANLFTDRQDVKSSDSCQLQAFQDNLWGNFWQFSDWFKFFLLELMAWSCSTFLCAIRSIAQRIFEHVLPCRRTTPRFVREVFAIPVISLLLQQKYVVRTFLCTVQWWPHLVRMPAECIPNTRGQEMM